MISKQEALSKVAGICGEDTEEYNSIKELLSEIYKDHEEIAGYWIAGNKKIDQLTEELKAKEAIIQHYETKLFRDEVIK
ncbi:hypothetical protein [Hydrogenimonas thermophila]|uniref:Uncharacterized protein n=1 Tax=Hydrogenimonas thermophila TaxID=223786 RepID=A0A1I5NQ76_9BACT|nr:hypothetical protein [Hydrogenimonas thermophila]SFP23827.1 hypothetical protein SAMN05216234_11164 [Hydrogenimonas thermophila]